MTYIYFLSESIQSFLYFSISIGCQHSSFYQSPPQPSITLWRRRITAPLPDSQEAGFDFAIRITSIS
jgi:hypothetical protein